MSKGICIFREKLVVLKNGMYYYYQLIFGLLLENLPKNIGILIENTSSSLHSHIRETNKT